MSEQKKSGKFQVFIVGVVLGAVLGVAGTLSETTDKGRQIRTNIFNSVTGWFNSAYQNAKTKFSNAELNSVTEPEQNLESKAEPVQVPETDKDTKSSFVLFD